MRLMTHGPALGDTNPFQNLERWHELLSNRYVCEACLTRYFMKYRRCKACGIVGRIRPLTAGLFELADSETELREIIAHGQVLLTEDAARPSATSAADRAAAISPPGDSADNAAGNIP